MTMGWVTYVVAAVVDASDYDDADDVAVVVLRVVMDEWSSSFFDGIDYVINSMLVSVEYYR